MIALQPTAADYARVFAEEQAREYPAIDAFERSCGVALDRTRLEDAARVLACPVKVNPPNWQHGRVLYALARAYLTNYNGPVTLLDIGTAKGFSALCLAWALRDVGGLGAVVSVDVIDPRARTYRNTVADCGGAKTLAEILEPWPDADSITFVCSTGVAWLDRHPVRVNVAFVDGKHDGAVVHREGELLAGRQYQGDLVVFDDIQIAGVGLAVEQLGAVYDLSYVAPKPERIYAIGVRR